MGKLMPKRTSDGIKRNTTYPNALVREPLGKWEMEGPEITNVDQVRDS
jgi:hypothetical protein